MALRSKNFLFSRTGPDGVEREYAESDSWVPTNKDYKWNENTLALAAGGYYGSTNGLHTVSFTLRNFSGRIYFQATLASNPTEDDWFNVAFNECGMQYIEFTDTRLKSSTGIIPDNTYGTTGTFAESVIGNFTYLRICISRDYISTDPSTFQKQYAGKIEESLINF